MLSTSSAFRSHVADGHHLDTKVEMTFADGTSTTLYGEDLTMGGLTFSTATSSTSSFDIGAAIIGSCDITLANYDGRWDDADFTDATAIVHVGATYDDGSVEWVRKGTYGIQQPESYDSTITLTCHDNMRLFALDYGEVGTTYPATLRTIVTDICHECDVTMLSASFPRDSLVIQNSPGDERTTCLDVLRWAAQAACCFADVDAWGRLRMRWYDTSAFEADDSFPDDTWAVVTAIKSLTTTTDDVVVTGVEVTASQQVRTDGTQGEDGETYLYGTAGYVLKVEGNPLIEYGQAQTVAGIIGSAVVGMRFRPLTVTSLGNPAIEAGDPMLVVDRRDRSYKAWVTSVTWKHGGNQTIACSAETPARNKADSYSSQTRAIVQQRNMVRAERTARERAIANLADQLEQSSGLYKTEEEQPDHSVIYYLHDKPTLAESQIIWKLTSQAFAISTDGGETYPFGFDAWGNAILNAIYTIGLDADYINTGALRIGTAENPLLVADFDAGTFFLSGAASIGNRTVQALLSDVDSSGVSRVEYGTSASSETEPSSWSTTVPTSVPKGSWLWIKTTYKDNSTSVAKAYAGTDGANGTDGTDGRDGADGATISSVEYATSTTESQPSSGWSTTAPSTVAEGSWLWVRTTYSDGTESVTRAKQGLSGHDGSSVTVSSVEYGTSQGASAEPSSWSTTVPTSVAQGTWLWVRTTYSDGTDAITKSYVGTDGEDGSSVTITSATKTGDITTVVITDGSTTSTLTIVDGEDGSNGIDGSNGYIHTAWANSPDGTTDFSTTVSANKTYLGVYTDNTETDSTDPSAYSWSLIKGADGADGSDGYNTATILLYQRSATQPSTPASTITYTFATHSLAGSLGGWSTSVPTGTDPCWVTAATTTSSSATDEIASSEWVMPTKLVENGADGQDGTDGSDGADGLNQATLYLYQRVATEPSVPSESLTYTFADGTLSGTLGGWSREIPATDGNPCWVTSAVAISSTATDTIESSDWSSPAKMAEDGTSVTVSEIRYGTSADASTQPSSWSATAPTSIAKGDWLWVRTTYSDDSTATTKSYVGTDGEDGTSVYVQSATKSGDTTTIVIADTDGGTNTLTIMDGSDGTNGTPGANGYVHTAWANSADGQTDFSTSVSTGKTYLGVYADNTSTDSSDPTDYSWSLIKGADGTSVTVSRVEYGTSDTASAVPSSWSESVPTSVAKGKWLWVRTTYSDNATATTKSYVGTDGNDGTSIYVTSTGKVGKTTTVNLSDGTTLTIADGDDGTDGTAGLSGYVHVAWANSSDGQTDFSTTVSADKSYIGVYTDNAAADSTSPGDYSWSLIKGADGTDGDDGVGITSIAEQYYLSTSDSTQTGGSWSDTQPTWTSGKYIWTRSVITWDTTPATTTTTTPILATALTQANSEAKAASDAVTTLDNSLDQAEVFKRLTDNGAIHGLYMLNGQLYMNASYINSGTLKLGGSGNGNGVLEVYDASDEKIGEWNNAGALFSGHVRMQIDAPTLGSGSVVATEMGSFSDSISTYYGTKAGTHYGLKVMSENTTSSRDNQFFIVPNRKGSTYDYQNSIYLASRSKMIIATDTSSGNGAYLGLITGETTLGNGAGNNSFSQVRLNGSSIVFYLWNGSSGFNALKLNYSGTTAVVQGSFYVSGTKSRMVNTDNYSDRLLYCYETPEPLFGDVGSGVIGNDGTCVVSIDDIFQETARTDMAYQVFLQKCGQGDLWVSERTSTYFVVEGTQGLAFDWELKAHQTGYETTRLENSSLDEAIGDMDSGYVSPLESYKDELEYIESIERLYEGTTE